MKSRLLEPFQIGKLELKNRIIMSAMGTQYASEEGYVTERLKKYHEARARGGVSMIIFESSFIDPRARLHRNFAGISDDTYIQGLSELVQVIHSHGARAAIQLFHGGRRCKSEIIGGQPVAPSPLAMPGGELPRELTIDEIAEIVASFAKAAIRAKEAGFDAVEIHGAHHYLIDQFISRFSNKRQDAYGGDLRHRGRLLTEVLKAVRNSVGRDYPISCRINGTEYGVEEGTTLEEAKEIARMAEEAGADVINVSVWGWGHQLSPVKVTTPTFVPAVIAELAGAIKKAVTVPVIAVGRITPEAGERVLKENKADLIAIGQGLLVDPELPNKVESGRLDDITPCIICMRCYDDLLLPTVTGIRCSVNAALGKEEDLKIIPVRKPRKVLVVGSGPAGMETARVAALRGHNVTVWEQEDRLGGQLIPAAIPPHKDGIGRLTEYLQTQLKKLNVKIEVGNTATSSKVNKFQPEVVVLATGVRPTVPKITGIDKVSIVHALDVINDKVDVGQMVVVIGGGSTGCETAEFLIEKSKKVTVVEMLPELASEVGPSLRNFFLHRLEEKGVILLTETICEKVTPGGIMVKTREGERKAIEADTIVIATGVIPENRLYEEIVGKVPEIHCIGDCVEPRTIRDAIAEGYRTGLEI